MIKKLKIIISGSEGFIGQCLKKYLLELDDCEIQYLDKINGFDLCNQEELSEIGYFDVFVHLAALSYVPESFKNPHKFYDVNFNSTLNVLELCRKYKAKMIFFSSYVYGSPKYLPIDEEHPLQAINPYAQTKIIGEQLCEGYFRDFDIGCTILRPFNIYGEGQNELFLIPSIIKKIKDGEKTIRLIDPNPRRDFVHVYDVVRAIKLCINNLSKQQIQLKHYNLASGKSYSVQEIVEIIKNIDTMFKEIKFEFSPHIIRKNEVNETLGSYEKIRKELGWEPTISIEEGLLKMLKHI